MAVIAGIINQIPYKVDPRSGSRRCNLQVPDVQINCKDLTYSNGCQDDMSYLWLYLFVI